MRKHHAESLLPRPSEGTSVQNSESCRRRGGAKPDYCGLNATLDNEKKTKENARRPDLKSGGVSGLVTDPTAKPTSESTSGAPGAATRPKTRSGGVSGSVTNPTANPINEVTSGARGAVKRAKTRSGGVTGSVTNPTANPTTEATSGARGAATQETGAANEH